ncbi:MAG: type I-E CRISPR-associated protein Cas5/CasD [Arachnia sp.]
MSVLLLRLAGPMQSWGDSSRFQTRGTRREPTKSGVLGLLAAAQGRRRTDSLEDLLNLRFGVRVDQPGTIIRDFHTAHDHAGNSMPLSNRYYLADAAFVAGVEGDQGLLAALDQAIQTPRFPLYLGRRACPAEGQISLGVRPGPLCEELSAERWWASPWHRKRCAHDVALDLYLDAEPGQHGDEIRDVPLSLDPANRQYGWRTVYHHTIRKPNPDGTAEPDWLAALGGA